MLAPSPSAPWQGPLRMAVAVFLLGLLVVWLIKPIGDPCPDLERLPQGSTASSSPSFAPPGTRTCTYTAAGGTRATSRYVPWLDLAVLLLVAGLAGAAAAMLSAPARAPRTARAPRAPRSEPAPAPSGERDAAERERARRERAERNR